jgi:hypothetical protein
VGVLSTLERISIDRLRTLANAWVTAFRSNVMNRRLLIVWLIAATPALLCAQETKLVNCRTLEAAGNFVGPDEVIDGNMVCQKPKPGATALAAKTEPAKPQPQPEPVIAPEQPMSVAEAARLNKQRLATTQNAASAPAAVAVTAAPTPAPAAESAPLVSKPGSPEVVREPARAAVPAPAASAAVVAPAQPQPGEPVATPEPAAIPAPTAPMAPAAPAMRAKRDAPVAAGTPSEPPEKDYGFSDANAVEAPVKAASAASSAASLAARTQVQVGAFGAPNESTAAGTSESQRPECAKNITLGSLQSEKLALGAPPWAQAWISRNQKAVPSVCFSAAPLRGARNYLIVFYFVPAGGNSNAAAPMPDSTSPGAFAVKDGSMWSYTGGVTQEAGQGQVWYVTAYSENGAAVAEEWPEQAKRGDNERVAEELLNGIVTDLLKF